jgi:serine/threonine protein kinase
MHSVLVTAHEIAAAMAYLHDRGIVHGDLSAYNVMLSSSGSNVSNANRGFMAKVC